MLVYSTNTKSRSLKFMSLTNHRKRLFNKLWGTTNHCKQGILQRAGGTRTYTHTNVNTLKQQ